MRYLKENFILRIDYLKDEFFGSGNHIHLYLFKKRFIFTLG